MALEGAWAPPTPKMLPRAEPQHGRGQGMVTTQALSPWGTTFFCHFRVFQPGGTPCAALPGVPKGVSRGRWHPAKPWGWEKDPSVLGDPKPSGQSWGGPYTPPCPNPAPACPKLSWRGTLGKCHREHRGHLRLLSPGQLLGVHFSVPITCWPPARPQHGTKAFPPGAPCPVCSHPASVSLQRRFLSEEGREVSADAGGVPMHPPHTDTPKL